MQITPLFGDTVWLPQLPETFLKKERDKGLIKEDSQ